MCFSVGMVLAATPSPSVWQSRGAWLPLLEQCGELEPSVLSIPIWQGVPSAFGSESIMVIYFLTQGICLISSEGVVCKFCSPRNNYYACFSSTCNQARATPSALDCDSQHGPVSILSPDWLNFCLLGFGSIAPCYLKRNWWSKQLSWAIVTARGRAEQLGHLTQT